MIRINSLSNLTGCEILGKCEVRKPSPGRVLVLVFDYRVSCESQITLPPTM